MNRNLATIIIIINFRVLAIKIPKISFISAFWFLTLYFGKTISPVRKRLISFPVRRRLAACRRPARGPSGCYFGSLFFSSLSLLRAFLGLLLPFWIFLFIPSRACVYFSSASAICIHFSCLQFEFICFWAISFFLSLSLSLFLFSAGAETSCCVWDFCRRVLFFEIVVFGGVRETRGKFFSV